MSNETDKPKSTQREEVGVEKTNIVQERFEFLLKVLIKILKRKVNFITHGSYVFFLAITSK